MSLLFDHVIGTVGLDDASLYAAEEGDLAERGPVVEAEPVVEFAALHESLTNPEEDWTCVPLHEPDSARPTGEFVAYTDHSLHGRIVVFERDGDRDFLPVEEFGATALADRIRFWHSDYVPDSYPPSYDPPVDDSEPPRNPVDPEDLLADLRAHVDDERAATRAENREAAERRSADATYRRSGSAIPEVRARGADGDGEYRFRVSVPDAAAVADRERSGDWAFFVESEFGVHEGNEVLLRDREDRFEEAAFPLAATVERIRGRTLWLTVDWRETDRAAVRRAALTADDAAFGVYPLLNPVPFDREREAVDALGDRPLADVLAGTRPLTFSHDAAARTELRDEQLNQEQQLAVEFALSADDLFCVHGPPGTGKTRTLVEIVRRAAAAGESVLVCADSNQAVDNLVAGSSTSGGSGSVSESNRNVDPRSLHAYAQHGADEFSLDRVNAGRSGARLVRERYADTPGRADVVAATNNSAATLAREFDLVVLDEATQATCTASCVPLARADRAVLAGDHRQLPPYSASETPPESSYGDSLFEHLYAEGGVYEGVGVQLQTQYRMHRDVAYYPNRAFYDRTLRNGRAVDTLPDRPAVEGYNVGGAVETVEHSKANGNEARLVAHLVRDLLDDVSAEEIGVITPYTAQVDRIGDVLGEALDADDASAVTVDTIDSFQGGERTAIVLSLVRSNADGEIGFLGRPADGPRRLNVALTRAKRYLAVVADWHTLRYDADGKCTDRYRDFYDHFESTGRLSSVDPEFIPT
ncbi:MAG: AAA domain-containing protein [Halosimplex sp.]